MGTDDKPPVEALDLSLENLHVPDLTVESVRNATHFSREHLEEWIANAERAWLDEDREQRLKQQECRWCYYARSATLAHPAFFRRGCESCKEILTYSSSNTNPLCAPCGKKLGLCVRCRADIGLANRAKLERKLPPDHLGGRRTSVATRAKRKVNRRDV